MALQLCLWQLSCQKVANLQAVFRRACLEGSRLATWPSQVCPTQTPLLTPR